MEIVSGIEFGHGNVVKGVHLPGWEKGKNHWIKTQTNFTVTTTHFNHSTTCINLKKQQQRVLKFMKRYRKYTAN